MAEDRPISRWLNDVQAGVAPEAEQGLWEEYFPRLCALARVQLRKMPPAYEGAEDVAVVAMKSFFRRVKMVEWRLKQIRKQLLLSMESFDDVGKVG